MFKMSCVVCALCGSRVVPSLCYSVTAHPDGVQTRPKHVGATNWQNIYHLCILVVFISNCTTMQGVEHIKLEGCLTAFSMF